MNVSQFFSKIVCFLLTLSSIQMALEAWGKESSIRDMEYYKVDNCTTVGDCKHVCGTEERSILDVPMTPLCDRNGNCVCSCTNMTIIDSKPIPSPCAKWLPSLQLENCQRYCSSVYSKPGKICGETGPVKKLFCTCLCKWY